MTDIWTDTSCWGYDRWMVDATGIWMDMSCWWYDRQMSPWIHLNHACDATPPQSTVEGVVVVIGKLLDLHSYWNYLDDTPIELGLLMQWPRNRIG